MDNISISGNNGTKLHGQHWAATNPRAIVCLVHGLGEHIGRYEHVARHLKGAGMSVMGMDLRGHGQSAGRRGHAPNLDSLIGDIEELLKTARAEYTELPMILFGHSMGGMLVLNYGILTKTNELKAIVASSPWLKLAFEPPKWKIKAGNMLAGLLPGFQQSSNLDASTLSKDPSIAPAYVGDPLVHDRITAGLFKGATSGGEFVKNQIQSLSIPTLMYHGDADQLIDYQTTKEVATSYPDMITWKSWEGVYHEPHNDLEKDQILEFLTSWILNEL